MIYSSERKRALDNIFNAFARYIREQNEFDIVYSEKVGYVWFLVQDPSSAGAEVLDTPAAMLDTLFDAIVNEVILSPDNPRYIPDAPTLTAYEETESRRRITAILDTMEEDRDTCLCYLNVYLGTYGP